MSFIPAFEFGLWNAWIFILPFFLLPYIGEKFIKKRNMLSLSEYISEFSKKGKILLGVLVILILGSQIYSIFLPIIRGTVWFYVGIIIFIAGFSIQIMAWQNLATAPVNLPVTKGIYRFSRNPMYIGDFLVLISVAIASLSWIFLLVAFISLLVNYVAVISEERECLAKYGEKYQKYMDSMPRWIGKPKSRKP